MKTKKDPIIFVKHIHDAILDIKSFTKQIKKEAFMNNKLVQNAVVRSLEIIGEAAKNIPSDFRKKHNSIPWQSMAAMRDKIIHHYFGLDLEIIWIVIEKDLPLLEKQIKAVLKT